MSYAIIRNEKYKRNNLNGIYRHNERKNKTYSNPNIDHTKSHLNYSLKDPIYSYGKEFDRIKETYNLKGQIKTVSNIACQYIITSDKEFFDKIGEQETRRYFETAYKFVCEYKNLGEQYILSAKVHMDEDTPHMHLVFIPVVHITDRKGNPIDKIACSEFWKERDSYVQLQNAFHSYVVTHGFQLDRGISKEITNREHLSVAEFKEITNYENTKKALEDIKLELPEVPNIKDFNKLTIKRDEKIQKEIIEPKDKVIKKLFDDNVKLQKELNKQMKLVDKAEKFELEKQSLVDENTELRKQSNTIQKQADDKEKELTRKFNKRLEHLANENAYLCRIIKTLENTFQKFIDWICRKLNIIKKNSFVNDFERETETFIDAERQIQFEDALEDEEEDEL